MQDASDRRGLVGKSGGNRPLTSLRRMWEDSIVIRRLTPEQTYIARQRLGKHIPAEANALNNRRTQF
jgi:hypothetical protein